MNNEIVLDLIKGNWMAEFKGQIGDEVESLFNTRKIPTAYIVGADRKQILREMQLSNPGIPVRFNIFA